MEEDVTSRFLRRLDPDPGLAEEKLLRLRQRIIAYLERRNVPSAVAEELVQEAILIVLQQLEAERPRSEEIQSIEKYIWGITKIYLKQHWRVPDEKGEPLDPEVHGRPRPGGVRGGAEEKEFEQLREECVRHCLQEVPPEERDAFVEYAQLEKRDEKRTEELAERLGISRNYFYLRMHRLRKKLEECCLTCLKRHGYDLK
ncbi:MAG TPA: sigma-70 family RNA polymerase sigma factor [Pyrinomonadaceae bacterium]